jgi:hypothetical protein
MFGQLPVTAVLCLQKQGPYESPAAWWQCMVPYGSALADCTAACVDMECLDFCAVMLMISGCAADY